MPRIGSIQGVDLKDPEFLLAHILISHDELPETHFTNLIGQNIQIFDKKIYVSDNFESSSTSGFSGNEVRVSHQIEVNILFEEIFYTKDMHKFKVWCIDLPIKYTKHKIFGSNISNEQHNIKDNTKHDINLYSITSLHDAINFIVNEIASKPVISKLDKLVHNFNRKLSSHILDNKSLQQLKTETKLVISNCISIAKSTNTINRNSTIDGYYLRNVEIAIETYCINMLYRNLFDRITLANLDETQNFNKIIRNLSDVHVSHFQIDSKFLSKIPFVKIELIKIENCSTFVDKLNCIRQAYNIAGGSTNQLTVDDFIPILVFVIAKSGNPHWIPNLKFLLDFCFTDHNLGSDRFLITTLEAAIRFIQSENVFKVNEHEKHKLLPLAQEGKSENPKIKYIFAKITDNDENEIINTYQIDNDDTLNSNMNTLCHPLCDCTSCNTVISDNSFTIHSTDANGVGALHIAAMYGLPKMINLLLALGANPNSIDNRNRSPLHFACSNGKQNSVLLLLHAKSNPNARDIDGNLPLHLSSANGHENCSKALLYFSDHMKIKLDINAQNNIGNTALHFASKWGFYSIVETLLEYGADPDMKNDQSQTSCDISHNFLIINILQNGFEHIQDESRSENSSIIRNTANINPLSLEQMTKIDKINQAIADNDTNLALFYLNFDLNIKCHPLCSCENCKSDNTKSTRKDGHNRVDINMSNCLGLSPLHAAAFHNNIEIIEQLLQHNADPTVKSRSGQTPLHLACLASKYRSVEKLLEYASTKILNEKDSLGNTALHIAVENNNLKLVEILLQYNPNKNLKNLKSDRPIDIADQLMLLTISDILKD